MATRVATRIAAVDHRGNVGFECFFFLLWFLLSRTFQLEILRLLHFPALCRGFHACCLLSAWGLAGTFPNKTVPPSTAKFAKSCGWKQVFKFKKNIDIITWRRWHRWPEHYAAASSEKEWVIPVFGTKNEGDMARNDRQVQPQNIEDIKSRDS